GAGRARLEPRRQIHGGHGQGAGQLPFAARPIDRIAEVGWAEPLFGEARSLESRRVKTRLTESAQGGVSPRHAKPMRGGFQPALHDRKWWRAKARPTWRVALGRWAEEDGIPSFHGDHHASRQVDSVSDGGRARRVHAATD